MLTPTLQTSPLNTRKAEILVSELRMPQTAFSCERKEGGSTEMEPSSRRWRNSCSVSRVSAFTDGAAPAACFSAYMEAYARCNK